jgi:hypothetical protein
MSVRTQSNLEPRLPSPPGAIIQMADLFKRLPDEILETIFTSLASLFTTLRYIDEPPHLPIRRLNAIYAIRPVCSRWKNVIDQAGHLHLIFIDGLISSAPKTPVLDTPPKEPERWGGRSLGVRITSPGYDYSRIPEQELVKRVLHQIVHLNVKENARRLLHLHLSLPCPFSAPIVDMFNDLGTLSRLEHLTLAVLYGFGNRNGPPTSLVPPIDLAHAPRLMSLKIVGQPPQMRNLQSIKILHFNFRITTPEMWHNLVQMMSELALLEFLSVNFVYVNSDAAFNPHANTYIANNPITLTQLTDLDFCMNSCACLGVFFGSFTLPSLTRLNLIASELSPCELPSPIQLPHFPRLRTFVCDVWRWCQEVDLLLRNSLPPRLDNFVLRKYERLEDEPSNPIQMPAVESLILYSPIYPTWDILDRKFLFAAVKKLEIHGDPVSDWQDDPNQPVAVKDIEVVRERMNPLLNEVEGFHFSYLVPQRVDAFMHSLLPNPAVESLAPKLKTFCQGRPSSSSCLETFPRSKEVTYRVPAIYGRLSDVCVVADVLGMVKGAENPLLLWKNAEKLVLCLTWGGTGEGDTVASSDRDHEAMADKDPDLKAGEEKLGATAIDMLLVLANPAWFPKLQHLEFVIHFQLKPLQPSETPPRITGECRNVLQRIFDARTGGGPASGGLSYIWGHKKGIEDRVSVCVFG